MKTKEKTLFQENTPPLRDNKGRYCTRERHYADKALHENQRLKFEKEKYYRSWLSVGERNSFLERKLIAIKDNLDNLSNEIDKLKQSIYLP